MHLVDFAVQNHVHILEIRRSKHMTRLEWPTHLFVTGAEPSECVIGLTVPDVAHKVTRGDGGAKMHQKTNNFMCVWSHHYATSKVHCSDVLHYI